MKLRNVTCFKYKLWSFSLKFLGTYIYLSVVCVHRFHLRHPPYSFTGNPNTDPSRLLDLLLTGEYL